MDREQVRQGRRSGPEDLALIGEWLAAHPHWNRTRLSRELCWAWNWRNGTGGLKDMACRTLLLKLEARGQIQLPPRRTASVNGARNQTIAELAHDQSPIQGELQALRPLQLDPLAEGSFSAHLFKFLLQRYHYLGHRNGVGQNLKYLVRDHAGRPLACLLFGSAAWKLRARDAWIGWNPEQRQRHLGRLTPVIVAPGQPHAIALRPEFIIPQDGPTKQDCEVAAAKRRLDNNGST
jgi:hypothetical protein